MSDESKVNEVHDGELKEHQAVEKQKEQPAEKKVPGTKRRIIKIAAWIFGSLIALLILAFVCRDFLIENGVRHIGSMVTGTNVEIDSFRTTLNGSIELKNIKVANPAGYRNPYAFEIDSIYVKLDVATLLSSEPVVETVAVKGVRIEVEPKGSSGGNLGDIQRNVEKFAGSGADKSGGDKKEKKEKDDSGKVSPLIKKISLESMSFKLSNSTLNTTLTIPLPPIYLANVGGKGTPLGESLAKIFGTLMNSINSMSGTIAGGADAISKTGETLKDSFSEGAKKLNDGVRSLFQKK